MKSLLDGPLSPKALADAIRVPFENINATLFDAIKHKTIVRVNDEGGRLHYALPGKFPESRFTPRVSAHAEVNPADPFGLFAKKNASGATVDHFGGLRTQTAAGATVLIRPAVATPSVHDNDTDSFRAYLGHTGDLTISAGSATVRLGQRNQRMLFDLLARIQGVGGVAGG